ncbi:hypothetical protein COLU111180_09425 [Cohnella lubricantis]|uniref:Uncharacterized protein n=1 Tax=Cohnella lubricantis TaxID=2163172 RepID=A0A841TC79_9BACL|nr:hypothetical protein [Cohnella lubricantis]MBB6676978.1 hypothetical protein [Cohnella lubricantis]MBP2118383.1 hypothetical protein [Cohnella lubricantis]
MILIGYGAVALLLIIILIVLNVRAAKRGHEKQEKQERQTPDKPGEENSDGAVKLSAAVDAGKAAEAEDASLASVRERAAYPPRSSRGKEPVAEATPPASGSQELNSKPETKDATYRQALRKLRTGSSAAAAPSSRANDKVISDSDYRKAMQNFRRSEEKEK